MLKKNISIAVIVAMIFTVFAGCTPEDVALYKALRNIPQSSVTKTTASFDVNVEEPISFTRYTSYDGDSIADTVTFPEVNYFIQVIGGLLSITDIEATTTKSGNISETKVKYFMPDAAFSFNVWTQTDVNRQAEKVIFTMPSYVRPMLPKSFSQKQYFCYDNSERQKALREFVGEDIPNAAIDDVITFKLATALQDEAVFDQLASVLDITYNTAVEKSGDNMVYTIKMDGKAFNNYLKGVISSMDKDEVVALLTTLTGVSAEEFRAAAENNAQTAEIIGNIIQDSGIYDNGITAKYTVGSNGYVVRTEVDVDINVDMPRIIEAAQRWIIQMIEPDISAEDMEEELSETLGDVSITGKFSIAASIIGEVTSINEALDVQLPQLTGENCIDVVKDAEEYAAYEIARSEWNRSWNDYNDRVEWVANHQPGETLTIRNNETGVEVVTVPMTYAELNPDDEKAYYYDDEFYVPLADMARLFYDDVVSTQWNGELMGVELKYIEDGDERIVFYPTREGDELFYSSWHESEEGFGYGEVYYNYDTVSFLYPSLGVFRDGKLYVARDFFYRGSNIYKCRFEDGKYCYTARENTEFQSDIDLSGNIVYLLNNMFYYW